MEKQQSNAKMISVRAKVLIILYILFLSVLAGIKVGQGEDITRVYLPMVKRDGVIPIGMASNPLYWNINGYSTVMEKYDLYTPEVAGWYYVVSTRGWNEMDALVSYADSVGKPVFYHCLSWNFLTEPTNYEAWIVEAMNRYPSIMDWVVVNENYLDPQIVWKYTVARNTRPDARLWYNGMFYDIAEQDAVKRLIVDGHVDAVGLQFHHNLNTDESVYIPLLEWLHANAVPWRITELDVAIPNDAEATLVMQANAYREAVELCWEYGCEAVTVWGAADGISNWLTEYFPLPFNENFETKPAWSILRNE